MLSYKDYKIFCKENNKIAVTLAEFNKKIGAETMDPEEWLELEKARITELNNQMLENFKSIKKFCSDCVEVGMTFRIEVNDLYRAYIDFCKKNSQFKPFSKRAFARRATPDIAGFVFNSNGKRYRRARLKAQKPKNKPSIVRDTQCQDCWQIHDPGITKCKACGSKNMAEI